MIYHILYSFHEEFSVLNVLRYITFRTAYASLTALLISLLLGPWLIARLRRFQIGQYIREEGPTSHRPKAGTPTMGGVLIIVSVVVPTLLWADLGNFYVWIAVMSLLLFGAVGFIDDYLKVIHQRSLGLKARYKLLLQALISLAVVATLLILNGEDLYSTQLSVPFLKRFTPEMDWVLFGASTFLPLILFTLFVIVGSSNAVNLSDGLDGLAAGLVIIAASALTVLTYVTGHAVFANYLDLITNTYASELTIFCGAMVGATLGFLWYNGYPAQIFMGDVGSNSLGGAIGDRGGAHQAGTALAVHWRHFCAGSPLGNRTGCRLQAEGKANFSNDSPSSSLRGNGLGGVQSGDPFLASGADLCIV